MQHGNDGVGLLTMRSGPGPLPAAGPRFEDERLIKGKGRFVANLEAPNALVAWFVRSPFANIASHLKGVELGIFAGHERSDVDRVREILGTAVHS